MEIYLELGAKRAFAGAVEWPGWCRGGRDEAAAIRALLESGPRYAAVMAAGGLALPPPDSPADLAVVEHLAGNATTEFGAPNIALAHDDLPVDAAELARLTAILDAIWAALDAAARRAEGRALRLGPRGGGRDRDAILRHVVEADRAYLAQIAWRPAPAAPADLPEELDRTRREIRAALAAAARGETPRQRPRGGAVWAPRTFTRRVAWHALDHCWELEDRLM